MPSVNSSTPMNCSAGTLPCALGEHGCTPVWRQPPSGSGNTRPSDGVGESSVATGVAAAAAGRSAEQQHGEQEEAHWDLQRGRAPETCGSRRDRRCYHAALRRTA